MNPKYLLTTIMMPYVKSIMTRSSYINNTMRGIGLRNIRKFGALRMPNNYNNNHNNYYDNNYDNNYDKYENKKQLKTIYKTNNDSPSPSSENNDDDDYYNFLEKQRRKWHMKKNRMSHMAAGSIPCAFCEGEGYVECVRCDQKGCWRCEHTGYEKCPFCDGTGDGRLSYIPVNPYNPPVDY